MSIFDLLDNLNFNSDEYVVVGGAVLEAHGIRFTNDIDIVVLERLFDECKIKGWIESVTLSGKPKLKRYIEDYSISKIELYLDVNTAGFSPSTNELIQRSNLINGFRFISLNDLLAFKKAYGRPKDLLDTQVIESILDTT